MTSSYGIPKFVIVGFKNTAPSVSVCDDSFIFPKVKNIKVTMGSQTYPQESLTCDVDMTTGRSRCAQAYNMYANFCWKMGNEPTMSINHFRLYDAIFCIDCSAHIEMIGNLSSNIDLYIELVTAPAAPITAYAIIFSDARFLINTGNGRMSHITYS